MAISADTPVHRVGSWCSRIKLHAALAKTKHRLHGGSAAVAVNTALEVPSPTKTFAM
jgi:hypothetical protein